MSVSPGVRSWVNPDGKAARRTAAHLAAGRTAEAGLLRRIVSRPVVERIGADRPEDETRAVVDGQPFVVDTGRNGNGPPRRGPAGRGVPVDQTAGEWFDAYALELARDAG
ncbi:hypothetical protein ACFQ7J_02860 [Streptomyces sp. NPDC056501]|uniref:hypothetical protein n=1 Tax=Streptomyces sp. NPDC056501 TaxID=3345841 RepID=UPI0036767C0E